MPFVKLGDEFKKVGDYQKRFRGLPDILELDHLTVAGDVTFGEGVKLQVRAALSRTTCPVRVCVCVCVCVCV